MRGIARGHFVSTPLEYAFDHEVSSLSYIIWRLFRQHRFGFAASILAWPTWSRRSGLAAIGGTVWYSKVLVRALSAYSHSIVAVLPSRHSSCAQFSVPSRVECRQVTPCRVSSALIFVFVPKGAAGRLWKLDIDENARFETQPLFSAQATSFNRKRVNAGGLWTVRKTAGRVASPSVGKASSLGWLAHELAIE